MLLPEISIPQSHQNATALVDSACPDSVNAVLDVARCGLARNTIYNLGVKFEEDRILENFLFD